LVVEKIVYQPLRITFSSRIKGSVIAAIAIKTSVQPIIQSTWQQNKVIRFIRIPPPAAVMMAFAAKTG
jgi:hypothetical protein